MKCQWGECNLRINLHQECSWIILDAPDVVNDEAGGGDEEVVHPVEAPADRLRVNRVVGDSSTGLIDHLVNTDGERVGC